MHIPPQFSISNLTEIVYHLLFNFCNKAISLN